MKDKPNILFIFSDQQRWDTLCCYGQKLDVSPNLDQMAREGVRFENAFTCQPVCGPARACLQTGKYATETGCFRNNIALPLKEKTLAHYLSGAGYEVGYIGKWHLASNGGILDIHLSKGPTIEEIDYRTKPIPPERRGGYKDFWLASDVLEFTSHSYEGHMFDHNMQKVDFKGYRVDCLTDFALEYLRTRSRRKPFFLFLSFLEPHHQNDHHRYEGPVGSRERFQNYEIPGDLAPLEGDWKEQLPDYLGCCASLDANVGRIRAQLDTLGLTQNTVVVYTSDHGSHFRTRNRCLEPDNYDDYKRSCHEASIRVPLIICGPGFEGGRVSEDLVSLIDIPPTILKCAGVARPVVMKGMILQDLIEGKTEAWHREVFVQISESQVGRAIRTKRWKYSVRASGENGNLMSASPFYSEDFLYDLEEDPFEQNNLVREHSSRKVLDELREALKRKMNEAGEKPSEIGPASATLSQ
jgi:arylsulfatase A-like enzyme